ncbi:MAG: hypothetical protein WKG07_37780 [Hymenobacter sp.]
MLAQRTRCCSSARSVAGRGRIHHGRGRGQKPDAGRVALVHFVEQEFVVAAGQAGIVTVAAHFVEGAAPEGQVGAVAHGGPAPRDAPGPYPHQSGKLQPQQPIEPRPARREPHRPTDEVKR